MKTLFNTLIVFSWLAYGEPAVAIETNFQIIVHPANRVTVIDAKFLSDIFLKRKIYWADQREVVVVDLDSSSPFRRDFSEKVLGRPVSAVRNYWQQLLYAGRGIPPPEFKDEKKVIDFVATHSGAIGYVSNRTELRDVKSVPINW
jgi:hypothetical protein